MKFTQKLVAAASAATMAFSLVAPLAAHAAVGQNPLTPGTGLANTYLNTAAGSAGITSTKTLPEIIGSIINVGLSLLGLVFLGLALYAGFKWMTSQGDSKAVDGAKGTLQNAVIGMVITVAAYAISKFVMDQLFTIVQ